MNIVVELDTETEARLRAEADRRGVAPEQYAVEFLRDNLPLNGTAGSTGKLTREGLREMTKRLQSDSAKLPVLPPEATERASFYEDRW
jgi:hypothetical protein